MRSGKEKEVDKNYSFMQMEVEKIEILRKMKKVYFTSFLTVPSRTDEKMVLGASFGVVYILRNVKNGNFTPPPPL